MRRSIPIPHFCALLPVLRSEIATEGGCLFVAVLSPQFVPDSTPIQSLGTEKCIPIVYEGVEAVRKTRDVLGPTDPSKAPPGSIRREFGQTIMVNAAHASDSIESATREFGIVKVGENNFRRVVEETYGNV